MILVIVDNRTTTSSSWLNYIDFLHLCPAYLLAASPTTTNGSVRPLPSPLLSFPSLSTFQDVLQRRTFGRQQLLLQLHLLLQLLHNRTRTLTTITISSSPENVLIGQSSGPLTRCPDRASTATTTSLITRTTTTKSSSRRRPRWSDDYHAGRLCSFPPPLNPFPTLAPHSQDFGLIYNQNEIIVL